MIINISNWETPATNYPRISLGEAEISTHYWKIGSFYETYNQKPVGYIDRAKYIRVEKRLAITTLKIRKKVWMVDDPPHWWSIQEHASHFSGRVVVAGLGLGLIVHALSQNPKVSKITVIEKNKDVISLIKPLVPSCEILNRDWYEKHRFKKVDGVFFDLFVGSGQELYPAAIRERIEISERFPGAFCRILGFNNNQLDRFVKAMES